MENQEVINYLLAHNDLKIIQRKDMFNFSLDTVLLSQFCTINKDVKNIVDFGTNNAAIPLLLSKRTPKKIIGIEIQDEAVDLARRNVEMNDLNDQIEVVHGDIKDVIKELPKAQLIVCNPPFFPCMTGNATSIGIVFAPSSPRSTRPCVFRSGEIIAGVQYSDCCQVSFSMFSTGPV